MFAALACLLVPVMVAHAAPIDPGTHLPSRVRAVNPAAQEVLVRAFTRSRIVRRLTERLEATDVIVYLEITGSPTIPRAGVRLVSGQTRPRYLRIAINVAVSPADRVPLLAHELQHALEIAHAPFVTDEVTMQQLYERIGVDRRARDRFETVEAERVERAVKIELSAASR